MRVRTKREASATITKIWVGRGFYGKEKLILSENMCMVHFPHEVKFQNHSKNFKIHEVKFQNLNPPQPKISQPSPTLKFDPTPKF